MDFHTNVGRLKCCQQAAVPSCQDTGKLTVTRRNYFQAAAFHLKQRIQIFKAAFHTEIRDYPLMCPMAATFICPCWGVGMAMGKEGKERQWEALFLKAQIMTLQFTLEGTEKHTHL